MPVTIAPDLQRRAATVGLLGLLAGCGELLPKAPPLPALFALDATDAATGPRAPRAGGRTLIVSPLTAAPGFDTARIVYVKEAHRLDHYAQSEWVDTPARMLAPQVVAAIAGTGAFAAVLLAPSGVAGDLRLDIALLGLQHDFTTPRSQVRLTLRATLWDSATRRVRQQRMFDERVDATRDDAYGGVLAANRAAAQALRGVAAMCVEEGGG